MKQFASPFKVAATGVTKAYLVGNPCGAEVTYDLTVANTTTGVATLSTTATIPPGVWRLKLVSSCGCHSMLVYTPPCKVTAGDGSGNYDGDGGSPDPIPSCDDGYVCPKPKINCLVVTNFCTSPEINELIDNLIGECAEPIVNLLIDGAASQLCATPIVNVLVGDASNTPCTSPVVNALQNA
jgi:hypothetical protein